MRGLLKKCPSCGRYTLEDLCPVCKNPTRRAHPSRFSPQDRYVVYRVRLKLESLEKTATRERSSSQA
uniref:Ribosome biogenesis protein Nop10 n=1 Tax=Fervidicoccus fontis TaxID=683846 RepID=A0A7J3ZJL0_9CREN